MVDPFIDLVAQPGELRRIRRAAKRVGSGIDHAPLPHIPVDVVGERRGGEEEQHAADDGHEEDDGQMGAAQPGALLLLSAPSARQEQGRDVGNKGGQVEGREGRDA